MQESNLDEMMAEAGLTRDKTLQLAFNYGNLPTLLYLHAIVSNISGADNDSLLKEIADAVQEARQTQQPHSEVLRLRLNEHMPDNAAGIALWVGVIKKDIVPDFAYHPQHEETIHGGINMLLCSTALCWKYPSKKFASLVQKAQKLAVIAPIANDLVRDTLYLYREDCPYKISIILGYYDANDNLLAIKH